MATHDMSIHVVRQRGCLHLADVAPSRCCIYPMLHLADVDRFTYPFSAFIYGLRLIATMAISRATEDVLYGAIDWHRYCS